LFFWWAMLGRHQPRGTAIGLLFLTGLHTAFLGVILSLARAPLYPTQVRLSEAYGADPLADQQLAGLVMWVPGGIAYVVAGLALAGLWIAHSSERSRAAQG
jgi:cytochrome c oxidase assembly factor CtaG